MATVLWIKHCIVLSDYLEEIKIINNGFYMAVFMHLKEQIGKERPQVKKKN